MEGNNKRLRKLQKGIKGITLIALVVTIIVLLILAGVAINLTIGNNGIFSRVQDAKQKSEKADWEDKIDMAIAGKMIENQNPTIDDIIDELIAEDIIDDPSQVNKENGDITTNEPSYVISDKLNDFISNVKIIISKTPETETSGTVVLKVEKVEGIDTDIDINNVDISSLSENEKRKMIKIIDVYGYNNFGIKFYTCFQDLLDDMGMSEQEYWQDIEEEYGNIDNKLEGIIGFLKEEKVETIKSYTVINPANKVLNNYVAAKNGNYTFKIKEIISGKEYKKSVEVTNINFNMFLDYYVGEIGNIYLFSRNDNKTTDFQKAYIIYNGEKIDITKCIYKDDDTYISCSSIGFELEDLGIIESRKDIAGTTQTFEIVKDGKSYFGEAEVNWVE